MSDVTEIKQNEIKQDENIKQTKKYDTDYGCIYEVEGIGKVVKIPDVKIGDTLYFVDKDKYYKGEVYRISWECWNNYTSQFNSSFTFTIFMKTDTGSICCNSNDIGNCIFYTKEDALKKIDRYLDNEQEYKSVADILTRDEESYSYGLFLQHESYKNGMALPRLLNENESLWEYKRKDGDKNNIRKFVCGECQSPAPRTRNAIHFELTPYCPHCGKKMVGLNLKQIEG